MIVDNRKVHWFGHTWRPAGRAIGVAACGQWGRNGEQIKHTPDAPAVTCLTCRKLLIEK